MPAQQWRYLVLLVILSVNRSLAQSPVNSKEVSSDSWKERGLLVGGNFSRYAFAEVGHYRNYIYRMGALPIYSTSLMYGCEVSYLDQLIIAPKVQARAHLYFFDVSIAPILYTDFSATSFVLRPEAGVGNHHFDINYGYNARLTNNNFEKLNRHLFSLRYYFLFRKRGHHEYNRQGSRIR